MAVGVKALPPMDARTSTAPPRKPALSPSALGAMQVISVFETNLPAALTNCLPLLNSRC